MRSTIPHKEDQLNQVEVLERHAVQDCGCRLEYEPLLLEFPGILPEKIENATTALEVGNARDHALTRDSDVGVYYVEVSVYRHVGPF